MIDFNEYEKFYYFTDHTLFRKKVDSLMLYAESLGIDVKKKLVVAIISRNRHKLKIIIRNKKELLVIIKESFRYRFPTTSMPGIKVLKLEEFLLVFNGISYRSVT